MLERIPENCNKTVQDILWSSRTIAAHGHGETSVETAHVLKALVIKEYPPIPQFLALWDHPRRRASETAALDCGTCWKQHVRRNNSLLQRGRVALKRAETFRQIMHEEKIAF